MALPSIFTAVALVFAVVAGPALAAPVTYLIDPEHTYPSFEADHMGLSTWRGKFNHTAGKVVLDKSAQEGSLQVTIDVGSIDFGNDLMNRVATGDDMFDAARYPKATYIGRLAGFGGGIPSRAEGTLSLRGITRPLSLQILSFRCVPHLVFRRREVCGADASGHFERDAFGIDAGRLLGFGMTVTLRIQVEAIEMEALGAGAGGAP